MKVFVKTLHADTFSHWKASSSSSFSWWKSKPDFGQKTHIALTYYLQSTSLEHGRYTYYNYLSSTTFMYRESLGSVWQCVCWLCIHCQDVKRTHQPPAIIPRPAPAPAPPWQWPWVGAGGGHITCLIISSYIMLWLCGDWQPCSLSPVSTLYFQRHCYTCLHWNVVCKFVLLLPNVNMWFQDFNWKTCLYRNSMCSWHFKCTSEKQVILS